jgi:hypothetical protein
MSFIHVCLVSEQTIPNILSIHHFKPDKVVFFTTQKMEGQKRTDSIINTLKLYGLDYSKPERHDKVLVDQDCLDDCELKFSEIANRYCNDDVVVNLTGGTKIMVIGAFQAAEEAGISSIYIVGRGEKGLIVDPTIRQQGKPIFISEKRQGES